MTSDAEPAGLSFTERMRGSIAAGLDADPLSNQGGLDWQSFRFEVRARIDDIDDFLRSDEKPIAFRGGHVESDHFGTCSVRDGEINLMVRGRTDSERYMRYRMVFVTTAGESITLIGYKRVRGTAAKVWYDTTRVFCELYAGAVDDPDERPDFPLIGAGVLEIPAITFLVQLTSFRPHGRTGRAAAGAYLKFMWFFSSALVLPYLRGLLGLLGDEVGEARRNRKRDEAEFERILRQSGRMAEAPPP